MFDFIVLGFYLQHRSFDLKYFCGFGPSPIRRVAGLRRSCEALDAGFNLLWWFDRIFFVFSTTAFLILTAVGVWRTASLAVRSRS